MDAIISPLDGDYYQRVKLPTAKDGKPIQLHDTVWGEDGVRWGIVGIGERYVWGQSIKKSGQKRLRPEWLTHEEPDSLERIIEEAMNTGCFSYCHSHDIAIPNLAEQAMRADLVRRCEALAVQHE